MPFKTAELKLLLLLAGNALAYFALFSPFISFSSAAFLLFIIFYAVLFYFNTPIWRAHCNISHIILKRLAHFFLTCPDYPVPARRQQTKYIEQG